VKEGRFREDLFYRLHVFPITVPPLRERPEDIPDLVRHFLVRFNAEEGKRIRVVAADAMALLARCPWPGNVRQLENAIFRAVVLAEGDEIGVDEFPQLAAQAVRPPLPPASEPAPAPEPEAEAPLMLEPAAPVGPAGPVAPSLQPQGPGLALLGPAGEVRSLADIEADVIRFAIAHYRGQMSEVARKLQIGRSTLYRKLDDLGVEDAGNASSSTDTVAAG
jgi:DNA-binding NtrC family response regulator